MTRYYQENDPSTGDIHARGSTAGSIADGAEWLQPSTLRLRSWQRTGSTYGWVEVAHDSGPLTVTLPAGDPVNAGRVVAIVEGGKTEHQTTPDRDTIGIALNSANEDEDVVIAYIGPVDDVAVDADVALFVGNLVMPGEFGVRESPDEEARIGLTLSAGAGVQRARLVIGDNALGITAVSRGVDGEDITVALVDPGEPDGNLTAEVDGTDIVVNLATDGEGEITTTGENLEQLLNSNEDTYQLVFANGGVGTPVPAMAATNLAGWAPADPPTGVRVLVNVPQMFSD